MIYYQYTLLVIGCCVILPIAIIAITRYFWDVLITLGLGLRFIQADPCECSDHDDHHLCKQGCSHAQMFYAGTRTR